MTFDTLFVRKHAFGTLLGVRIPQTEPSAAEIDTLHPAEREVLEPYRRTRRGTWVGGRLALSRACEALGKTDRPLLNDARGAPILPAGVVGSLTHKDDIAIALVQLTKAPYRLGIDLEKITHKEPGVGKMVLTEAEMDVYESLDDYARASFLIVRFSLKEAIYKALDPFVKRYVGFKEVKINQNKAGDFTAQFMLKNNEGPFKAELLSEALESDGTGADKHVLSTARIRKQ